MKKILIKACLNGDRSRSDHPAVPISPHEIAAEAAGAAKAGAGAVHVHPRRADGSETLDPQTCDAVVRAVRASCPGLPVGLTTGAWIDCGPGGRLHAIDAWSELPDFVSVNFSESGVAQLCMLLLDKGIGVEAGVQTAEDVGALASGDVARRCMRILVEAAPTEPQKALNVVALIDDALDASEVAAPRLYHGCEGATWAVLEAAMARGDSVRVGLEDVTTLPNGKPARDNADLVAAAMQMASRHEFSVRRDD